jgi:tetratricopeptide (TPR) repeat protein
MCWLLLTGWSTAGAQTNCRVFTDSCHINACQLYNQADSFGQGTRASQLLYDSAIRVCADYAEAWHEISVPYLKRGDFFTWRKYLDKAVQLQPKQYLGTRGWCRFKFIKDYEGALEDLQRFDTLSGFHPSYSGDGNYHLYLIMAFCERELGNYKMAMHYFTLGIDSVITQQGVAWTGFMDYLHRAVTKMQMKDYTGALQDIDRQIKKYDNYAEIYYYQALILHALHRNKEVMPLLQKAKALVTAHHHLFDIYCVMPDQVFMEDIDEAINKLSK